MYTYIREQLDAIRQMLLDRGYYAPHVERICRHLLTTYLDDDKYQYADSLRIARTSMPEELREYARVVERGCCGFYDTALCIGHMVYLIGFNHGH
jgi:hypothetical protein